MGNPSVVGVMLEIQTKAYRESMSLDVRRRCKLYVYLGRVDVYVDSRRVEVEAVAQEECETANVATQCWREVEAGHCPFVHAESRAERDIW